MSSSPGLPSPSQLFSSMPLRLPSGSKAAPIPGGSAGGFASAATLLHQVQGVHEVPSTREATSLGLVVGANLQDAGHIPAKAIKGKTVKKRVVREKKPVFKTPGHNYHENAVPKDGHVVNSEQPSEATKSEPKAAAPKRPRKKKDKEGVDGQTKIKQAKVTKPHVSVSIDKAKKPATGIKKTKGDVSNNANMTVSTQDSDAQAREEFRDLCIEKAVPIRRDWTPVRDTVIAIELPTTTAAENVSGPTASVDSLCCKAPPIARFSELLNGFGFAQANGDGANVADASRCNNGQVVVKKRKIELVQGVCVPPPVEKPRRSKSPKKLQTVTAKATAPFRPVEPTETQSLLQYFATPTVGSGALTNEPTSDSAAPVDTMKPPAKRATKAKSSIVKTRVKKAIQPILLSPQSAMKSTNDQELIFGTSSQLVREDSPSFLKDTLQAIKASESADNEWVGSQPPAKFKPYNSLALTPSRNLWLEAFRDLDGSLLDAEVVDLSETPKGTKASAPNPVSMIVSNTAQIELQHGDNQRSRSVMASVDPKLHNDNTPVSEHEMHLPQASTKVITASEPDLSLPRSVAEAALKKRRNSRSPVKKTASAKSTTNQIPDFHSFTDLKLSKAVSAYGFKSMKRREDMIGLLERCWESKAARALQEVPVNTSNPWAQDENISNIRPIASVSAKMKDTLPIASDSIGEGDIDKLGDAPTKKRRGRPRKDPSATTPPPKKKRKPKSIPATEAPVHSAALATDDIYDSSPPTPSPPRRRSPLKSPAQLPLSQTAGTVSTTVEAISARDQKLIFDSLTKAITTFPPSHDPQNTTFHEKILMYEPIILEDLAFWLNAEGLGKVGEDNEVSPMEVKEWCEERSICCLWKENLRGGTRGRW